MTKYSLNIPIAEDSIYTLEDIVNRHAKRFIIDFSKNYGLFPGFTFRICSPKKAWYQRWGEIVLINDDILRDHDLSALTKYLLFLGITYHTFIPATELNRILIILALRRSWGPLSPESESFLISLFSAVNNLYLIQGDPAWRDFVNGAFLELAKNLKVHSPLAQFFINLMLGISSPKKQTTKTIRHIISIIRSDLPIYLKARLFFETLKSYFNSVEPWTLHERSLRKFLIPLSSSDLMPTKKEEINLSTSDMEQIAAINYDFAKKLAKTLDRALDKDKTPAYSNKKHLHQKLLHKKRYLASVRRVRINKIISALETKLINLAPSLERYGFSVWYLGDEVEKLDLEASAENYGHVIPNFTTLRNIYSSHGSILSQRKFGHIELCIDTSGSMSGESLETAIEIAISFLHIAKRLNLSVGLVTFSSGAWESVPPTREYEILEEILLRLDAEGGTNIRHALDLILKHINSVNTRALVTIISDSHIYDINFPRVLSSLQNISAIAKPIFIVVGTEPWNKTMNSLVTFDIPLLKIDKTRTIIDYVNPFLSQILN